MTMNYCSVPIELPKTILIFSLAFLSANMAMEHRSSAQQRLGIVNQNDSHYRYYGQPKADHYNTAIQPAWQFVDLAAERRRILNWTAMYNRRVMENRRRANDVNRRRQQWYAYYRQYMQRRNALLSNGYSTQSLDAQYTGWLNSETAAINQQLNAVSQTSQALANERVSLQSAGNNYQTANLKQSMASYEQALRREIRRREQYNSYASNRKSKNYSSDFQPKLNGGPKYRDHR